MNILEAGARSAFKKAWPSLDWDIDLTEKQRTKWRTFARACWTAMVEGLSDRQVWDLALPTPKVREPFDCESPYHRSAVTERRAALLELMEVKDE